MATKWVDGLKTVCVDWNGVLDTYQGYVAGKTYAPREGAKEFLENLMTAGYKIVVLTAADTDEVERWLYMHGMLQFVHLVTNMKVPAIIYIDDRAITFTGDFQDTFEKVLQFRTFWETGNIREG